MPKYPYSLLSPHTRLIAKNIAVNNFCLLRIVIINLDLYYHHLSPTIVTLNLTIEIIKEIQTSFNETYLPWSPIQNSWWNQTRHNHGVTYLPVTI